MKAGLNLISRGFVKQGYLSDRYGSGAAAVKANSSVGFLVSGHSKWRNERRPTARNCRSCKP